VLGTEKLDLKLSDFLGVHLLVIWSVKLWC